MPGTPVAAVRTASPKASALGRATSSCSEAGSRWPGSSLSVEAKAVSRSGRAPASPATRPPAWWSTGSPWPPSPAARSTSPGVGTLVLFEQVTDVAGSVRANGLRLEDHGPRSRRPGRDLPGDRPRRGRRDAGRGRAGGVGDEPWDVYHPRAAPPPRRAGSLRPAPRRPRRPQGPPPARRRARRRRLPSSRPHRRRRPARCRCPPSPAPTPVPSVPATTGPALGTAPAPLALPTQPVPEEPPPADQRLRVSVSPVYGKVAFSDDARLAALRHRLAPRQRHLRPGGHAAAGRGRRNAVQGGRKRPGRQPPLADRPAGATASTTPTSRPTRPPPWTARRSGRAR